MLKCIAAARQFGMTSARMPRRALYAAEIAAAGGLTAVHADRGNTD